MTGEEMMYTAIGAAPVLVYTVYGGFVSHRAHRAGLTNPYRILDNSMLVGGIGGWVGVSGLLACRRDSPVSLTILVMVYITFLSLRFLVMKASQEYEVYRKIAIGTYRKIDQALDEDGKGTDA